MDHGSTGERGKEGAAVGAAPVGFQGGQYVNIFKPRSRLIHVRLTKNAEKGEKLGIVLKNPQDKETKMGQKVAVGSVSPAGVVASWNEANPSRAIGPGDEFVRVNGKATNEEIIEELKGNSLDLVLCGPVPGSRAAGESDGPNLGPYIHHGICLLAVVNIGWVV